MDAPLSPSGRPGRRGGRQRSPDGFLGPYGTGEGGPKQTLLRILTFLTRAEALSQWPMPVDCRPIHPDECALSLPAAAASLAPSSIHMVKSLTTGSLDSSDALPTC